LNEIIRSIQLYTLVIAEEILNSVNNNKNFERNSMSFSVNEDQANIYGYRLIKKIITGDTIGAKNLINLDGKINLEYIKDEKEMTSLCLYL